MNNTISDKPVFETLFYISLGVIAVFIILVGIALYQTYKRRVRTTQLFSKFNYDISDDDDATYYDHTPLDIITDDHL